MYFTGQSQWLFTEGESDEVDQATRECHSAASHLPDRQRMMHVQCVIMALPTSFVL